MGFLTLVFIMLNKNLKTVAEVQYDKQFVYILTQHLFSKYLSIFLYACKCFKILFCIYIFFVSVY